MTEKAGSSPKLRALKRAVTFVAAVISSFGGFLLHAQPPEGVVSGFAVGFASTICVMIFLAISVIANLWVGQKSYRSIFLALAVALMTGTVVVGFRYETTYAKSTIMYPDEKTGAHVVIGDFLTNRGSALLAQPTKPYAEILADAGGVSKREVLWTRSSIVSAILKVNDLYVAFVVLLSSAVFCLLEGLLPSKH